MRLPLVRRARQAASRPRLHFDPLWVLIPVILCIAIGLWLERTVNERWMAISQAKGTYATAIAETRGQLENLVTKVSADKIIFANINWQLSHSVNSALSAKLERGQLDQLTLFDANCGILGKASSGHSAPVECPIKKDSKIKLGQFYWTAIKDVPTLWLVAKTTGVNNSSNSNKTADVYVVGMVHLDANWLGQHASLKQTIDDLDLVIGTAEKIDGAVIHIEGKALSNPLTTEPVAILGSTDYLDRYLPTVDGIRKPHTQRFLAPALLCALVLIAMALWKRSHERQNVQNAQEQLRHWSASLNPTPSFLLPGKTAAATQPAIDLPLDAVKKNVHKALQAKQASERQQQQEKEAIEALAAHKDEEIRRLKIRLSELAELDSLAQQLKRTTGEFLKRLHELHDQSESVADRLEDYVATRAKTLAALLEDWRKGIADRGARKFLRSLSETPAKNPGRTSDATQLDEQLDMLIAVAHDVGDHALSITLEAQTLGETAAFATQVVGLWHGLALRTGEMQSPSIDLLPPIQDAQRLIHLEADHRQLNFKNLLTSSDCDQIPALPRTIWTTALYHMYLAMAELTHGHPQAVIASRIRRDQNRILLVVSIAGEQEDVLPKRGDKQAYHLDIARSLLAPFEVNVTVLPSLSGPFPIVMSWEPYTNSHAGKTKSLKAKDREKSKTATRDFPQLPSILT